MDDDSKNKEQLLAELERTRQRMEELKEQLSDADRHRKITEAAKDPIFSKDLQSKYTYVNEAMQRLFGASAKKLIGLTPRELFDEESAKIVEAIDAPVFKGEVSDAVRTINIQGKEHTFHTVQLPMREADGQIKEICGFVSDITDRLHAENALRESLEFNETILSVSPLGISIYKESGPCVSANQAICRIVGAPREKVIAQPYQDISSWKVSGLIHDVERVLSEGISVRREIHTQSSFDKEVWLDCLLSRFHSEGEAHLLLIVDDISERKKTEEEGRKLEAQVQHTQKLESLGVLAGGIAHDFNNMLFGIMGNADLALLDLPAHSEARTKIHKIIQATNQCAELTNQMLAYSGKGKFVIEEMDLHSLVDEMKDLLASAVSKNIELRIDIPKDLLAIKGDPSQIRQIVLNLAINASEAIGDKPGSIELTAFQGNREQDLSRRVLFPSDTPLVDQNHIAIQVSDTGAGMDEETQDLIFDPFFTTKFTGRGLGLAAVHGIVRGHQGSIHLDSRPGQGTTFTVYLPAQDQTLGKTLIPAPPQGEDWRGSGTILLAEDDEMVRQLAHEMLEMLGFTAVAVADGQEAIEAFQKHKADIVLVILDLTMPRLGGAEALDQLQKMGAQVPLILSSGFSETEAFKRFADKSLAGFIQKPYSLATLKTKLRGILQAPKTQE